MLVQKSKEKGLVLLVKARNARTLKGGQNPCKIGEKGRFIQQHIERGLSIARSRQIAITLEAHAAPYNRKGVNWMRYIFLIGKILV